MPLALRHYTLLQVLLVDHGLQGGVHLVGERLAVLLHSAGGGQLGGGGICAQQVAQVQRVGVDRCSAGGVTPSAGLRFNTTGSVPVGPLSWMSQGSSQCVLSRCDR